MGDRSDQVLPFWVFWVFTSFWVFCGLIEMDVRRGAVLVSFRSSER